MLFQVKASIVIVLAATGLPILISVPTENRAGLMLTVIFQEVVSVEKQEFLVSVQVNV